MPLDTSDGPRRLKTPTPPSESRRVDELSRLGTARPSRQRSPCGQRSRNGQRSRSRSGQRSRSCLRSRARSRSGERNGRRSREASHRCSRACSRERSHRSILEQEKELDRERERLRKLEHEVHRARSLLSNRRRGRDSRSRLRKSPHRDSSLSPHHGQKRGRGDAVTDVIVKSQPVGTNSLEFSTNDVLNLLSTIKNFTSQPPTTSTSAFKRSDHKNILPEFDPSLKNQRVDIWLKKVNECSSVYGWDDKTIVHFAMQKLQGLAKTWYESLNTILFTWPEWQEKLLSAFPFEQNYGQSLEDMLIRKSRYNEPIEVYFYEKLGLLNQCDITGKRATECIIHGITDKTTKSSALALRCEHPDQLLKFLMSTKENPVCSEQQSNSFRLRLDPDSNTNSNPNRTHDKPTYDTLVCFNCKEKGHPFLKCPKPLINCSRCEKVGHTAETCFSRPGVGNIESKTSKR